MTSASVLLCGAKNTFASLPVPATTPMISIVEGQLIEALGVPIEMVDVVWRHGQDIVWHGHLCIALARGRRLGSRQSD
jgi:hypothetical protein